MTASFASRRCTRPVRPSGDLVVEVASPSTARYDAATKLGRYLAAGAREVWLVSADPLGVRVVGPAGERRVDADGTLSGALLPGFRLPLAALCD